MGKSIANEYFLSDFSGEIRDNCAHSDAKMLNKIEMFEYAVEHTKLFYGRIGWQRHTVQVRNAKIIASDFNFSFMCFFFFF